MPDESPAPAAPPEGVEQAPPESEPQTFDADYVKKLRAEAAKYRNEAKANAEAAKRLAELEESQKSEAQKLADAKAAAEREAEQARAEALRWRVAAKHGISDEDAELFLTGTDEETLTKQATRLAEHTADAAKPRPPKPRGNEGRDEPGSTSTADQFASAVGGFFQS